MGDLFDAYQRKAPTDRQLDLWWKKLDHIPENAFRVIVDWILDNYERMPANLVKEVKAGHRVWVAENQGRRPAFSEKKKPCDECGGTGYIWFKAFLKAFGYSANFTAICGRCENWRADIGSIDGMIRTTVEGAKKWAVDEQWLAYLQGLSVEDLRRHPGIPARVFGKNKGNVETDIAKLPWDEERG